MSVVWINPAYQSPWNSDTETTATKGLRSWDESIWTADLSKPPERCTWHPYALRVSAGITGDSGLTVTW